MGGFRRERMWGGALLAALSLVPAVASGMQPHRKRQVAPQHNLSIAGDSIGSFTPAAADARFGASFGRAGLVGSSGFRFTPSITPGNDNRRVTVAVRVRSVSAQQAERSASSGALAGPYAYNLGVSMGWKRFAVTSDYNRVDLGVLPGSRESADVALSYSGKRWSTRLALGADRPLGDAAHLVDGERGVSVDLGGSYSITSHLDLTGGVRYKVDRDSLQFVTDDRRDSQAIYIGTAFRF
ncbi:MAG TPA: hypothetical protein VGC10_00215 [Sphingomonas sp.]